MDKLTVFQKAVDKKIVGENEFDGLDRFGAINHFFFRLQEKYGLGVLIQSNVELSRGKMEYQCMIGYAMGDIETAQTLSNGLGDTLEEAIFASINEFIEYYSINYDQLKH